MDIHWFGTGKYKRREAIMYLRLKTWIYSHNQWGKQGLSTRTKYTCRTSMPTISRCSKAFVGWKKRMIQGYEINRKRLGQEAGFKLGWLKNQLQLDKREILSTRGEHPTKWRLGQRLDLCESISVMLERNEEQFEKSIHACFFSDTSSHPSLLIVIFCLFEFLGCGELPAELHACSIR